MHEIAIPISIGIGKRCHQYNRIGLQRLEITEISPVWVHSG